MEYQNAISVAEIINIQQIERIFHSSTTLSGEAIVHFMANLTRVAANELLGVAGKNISGDGGARMTDEALQPRVFCLQKVVEMADYNMNIRPRVVWAKLWKHISQLFEKVGAHPNPLISAYAIDSLKQAGGVWCASRNQR